MIEECPRRIDALRRVARNDVPIVLSGWHCQIELRWRPPSLLWRVKLIRYARHSQI